MPIVGQPVPTVRLVCRELAHAPPSPTHRASLTLRHALFLERFGLCVFLTMSYCSSCCTSWGPRQRARTSGADLWRAPLWSWCQPFSGLRSSTRVLTSCLLDQSRPMFRALISSLSAPTRSHLSHLGFHASTINLGGSNSAITDGCTNSTLSAGTRNLRPDAAARGDALVLR